MNQKIDYTKIYSPSRLGMFALCPKQYHFYYLDPVYGQMKNELKKLPNNIWSFHTLGKAVHNAITLFYHSSPEERTLAHLKEHLKETWQSEVRWNKKPPLEKWGGFGSLEEEREVYAQALSMLTNFSQMADIGLDLEYLPTKDFRQSIKDYQTLVTSLSKDFDISGKFDLVAKNNDDSLHIIDFKTSKKENGDYFQLRFYKLLAEENFKKPVSQASFYFLKTGNVKQFDLREEKAEEIKEEILTKINQIKETKHFDPKPSKLCQFCLFKTFCPVKGKVKGMIKDVEKEDYADDLPF